MILTWGDEISVLKDSWNSYSIIVTFIVISSNSISFYLRALRGENIIVKITI